MFRVVASVALLSLLGCKGDDRATKDAAKADPSGPTSASDAPPSSVVVPVEARAAPMPVDAAGRPTELAATRLIAECDDLYLQYPVAVPVASALLAQDVGRAFDWTVHARMTAQGLRVLDREDAVSPTPFELFDMMQQGYDVAAIKHEVGTTGQPDAAAFEAWLYIDASLPVRQVATLIAATAVNDDALPIRIMLASPASEPTSYANLELARELQAIDDPKTQLKQMQEGLAAFTSQCAPLAEAFAQSAAQRGSQRCHTVMAGFDAARTQCGAGLGWNTLATLLQVMQRPELVPRSQVAVAVTIDWSKPPSGDPDARWGDVAVDWVNSASTTGTLAPLPNEKGGRLELGRLGKTLKSRCTFHKKSCAMACALGDAEACESSRQQ